MESYLRIVCGFNERDHFRQLLLLLLSSDDHLEDADRGPALALEKLRVGIETLKDIEGLHSVVKVAHLVAVIGNQAQDAQTGFRRLQVDVHVPGETAQ